MHIESNDGLTETLCLKLPKYCKYLKKCLDVSFTFRETNSNEVIKT